MKKLFFTLSIVALTSMGVFAQGISGGLKAGLNLANQQVSFGGISASADSRTSFHFGGYLNLGVSEKFSVQPELLYNSLGSKSEDYVLKANYLSIPVMFQFNPSPIFNIHAGPQLGFLLSAKDGDDNDMKDAYKGLDLGAGLGIGVNLPMGLGFSARYVFGLSNISEVEDSDFGDVEVKNTAFQLSATYKLFGGE